MPARSTCPYRSFPSTGATSSAPPPADPIKRSKLFWFFSYEGLRLRQAGAGLTTVSVPTALQLAGNFSATKGGIFDPDTLQNGVRTPFPGNMIPAQRINPLALAAVKALPLPNLGVSAFVNSNGLLKQTNDNYSGRVDYMVTPSLTLFGRYSMADEDAIIPATVTGRDNVNNVRPQNFVVGATKTLRPNLVNETRVAFSRFRQVNGLPELNFNVNGTTTQLPQFLVSGYPTMGGAGSFTGTTAGGIVQVRDNTYQVYDNVFWQHGRHSVKFGGEALQVQYNRYEAPSALANFQFTNGFTTRTASHRRHRRRAGEHLPGAARGVQPLGGPEPHRRPPVDLLRLHPGRFPHPAQPDVEPRPALRTGAAGLRRPAADGEHRLQQRAVSAEHLRVRQDRLSTSRSYSSAARATRPRAARTRTTTTSRRGSASCGPINPKTVIRAGAGVYYAATDFNPLFRLAAGLPDNLIQTLTSNNFVPQYRGFDIFGPAVVGPVPDSAGRHRYQPAHQLLPAVDVHGAARTARQDCVRSRLHGDVSASSWSRTCSRTTPSPDLAQSIRAVRTSRSITRRERTFPSYVNVVGNSVPVGFINYLPHSAQSNYHSLFMRVEKPFSNGLSWLASYTFSKAITNAPQFRNAGGVNGSENSPAQDAFNLRAERGLASFDTRQRLVNTVVYQLPFGRNQKYLRYGVASKVLGGWETSGIVTAQSGFPYTPNLRGDTAGVGAGTGGIFVRPNLVPGTDWQLPAISRAHRATSTPRRSPHRPPARSAAWDATR